MGRNHRTDSSGMRWWCRNRLRVYSGRFRPAPQTDLVGAQALEIGGALSRTKQPQLWTADYGQATLIPQEKAENEMESIRHRSWGEALGIGIVGNNVKRVDGY